MVAPHWNIIASKTPAGSPSCCTWPRMSGSRRHGEGGGVLDSYRWFRQWLRGSFWVHRYGLAARDRLPHRCWTVPCPFACCRKVRRATALFVHIGSGLRGGECGDSGLHSRLHVADLEEDLVVGAGSVRGGIWSRAFLPLEPIFAGIRTRRRLVRVGGTP